MERRTHTANVTITTEVLPFIVVQSPTTRITHNGKPIMSDDDGKQPAKVCKKETIAYADVHFEVAKTSRAKCVECCVGIEKGETKISKEVNSQNGKVIKSYHPNCALHVQVSEDNRSKCQTCKEKLSMGQMKVKVGSSCKTGPGSKHHYVCIFKTGANEGFEKIMQDILEGKKNGTSESTEDLKTKMQKPETPSPTTVKPSPKSKPKGKKAPVKIEEEDADDDDDDDEAEEESEDDDDDDEDDGGKKSKKKSINYNEDDGPSRKSSRTRAKVSYNDDLAGEDDDEE